VTVNRSNDSGVKQTQRH